MYLHVAMKASDHEEFKKAMDEELKRESIGSDSKEPGAQKDQGIGHSAGHEVQEEN